MNIISLEELEKLTEKLYGPLQDPGLINYSNMLKENFISNFASFQQLFQFFIDSKSQHCLFWLLDLLTSMINSQYKYFPDDYKAKFRELIVFIFESHIQKVFIANFIETKFCVLLINWLKHDYPENWSSFFKDIITMIFNTTDENLKRLKVSLLIDLLLTFDDELIKFRHTYTDYEVTRSTIIKDYMRLEAVNECVFVINELMKNESHFPKKLIKNSIKVISLLIDWNLLSIFEESVRMITNVLINNREYENESLEVLNAIIQKGMELNQKLELIKYLNLNEIIGNFLKNPGKLNENSLFHICEIVGNIGNLLIECFEMVKGVTKGEQVIPNNNSNPQELFNYVSELTNYILYYSVNIINFAYKIEIKTALHLCDFISTLTTYLKTNTFIAENFQDILKSLVSTIQNLLIIPSGEYDVKSTVLLNKDDDDFFGFRKEYTVLFYNFFHVAPLKLFILDSINQRLEKVSQVISGGNYQIEFLYEVELSLHLVSSFQTAVLNTDIQNTNLSDQFNKLLYYLFNIPFGNVDSDLILIIYYETVYKYIQYIIGNENILIYVCRMYLSKQGVLHPNPIVGSRICNSFEKFVDKVKSQIGKLDVIYEISDTLKNFLIYLCVENKNFHLITDYNVLFKTLGQTILQKHFNEDKRQLMYKEALALFDSIINNFGLDTEKFIEVSRCITNFIKNIGFELNPVSKIIFIDYFNNFINNIYLKFPKHSKVDYAMLTIIQRLITLLGKDSLSYVEYFIQEQVKYPENEMYEDYCKLLQNSTQLLKKESKPLVQNCLFYFYNTIKSIELPKTDISEIEKNVLSIYSNFAKLLTNITNDIVEVFFENGGIKNLDIEELFKFLTYIACEVIDPNIRRSIVKSLKAIVLQIIKMVTSNFANDERYNQLLMNYVEIILSGSFQVYSKLNVNDPYDFNVGTIFNIIFLIF